MINTQLKIICVGKYLLWSSIFQGQWNAEDWETEGMKD